MTKYSIAWYEEGLVNSTHYEAQLKREIANKQETLDKLVKCNEFTPRYEAQLRREMGDKQETLDKLVKCNEFTRAQIAEAKRRGLTEYDRERLLKKGGAP